MQGAVLKIAFHCYRNIERKSIFKQATMQKLQLIVTKKIVFIKNKK